MVQLPHRQAIRENLKALPDSIRLEVVRRKNAKARDLPLLPAFIVEGVAGARIRFFGTPSGPEFASFLEGLREAAEGKFALHPATDRKFLTLGQPVRMDVMVPPSCVVCPPAVREAQKLAFLSPQVTANIIKLADFPAFARWYHGDYSTHLIVNGHEILWEGISEAALADRVLDAAHDVPYLHALFQKRRAVA